MAVALTAAQGMEAAEQQSGNLRQITGLPAAAEAISSNEVKAVLATNGSNFQKGVYC